MIAPFEISYPDTETPLLYDSPHSGRFYPHDFHSNADHTDLRRGEDAFVDELLAGTPAFGATVLSAVYPRCYIDVNRAESDIDETLLSEPWPGPIEPTDKSKRGLGLIRRLVVPGVEAQARPLTSAELRARLERVYRPYHRELAALVARTKARRGIVRHVNWHSMKSVGNAMTPDGHGARRPDFVVSDLDGKSADHGFTCRVANALKSYGYSVSINEPYKGGTIVQRIGDPANGVHSVQVEINRRLYLDERTVERTTGFRSLASALERLTRELVD